MFPFPTPCSIFIQFSPPSPTFVWHINRNHVLEILAGSNLLGGGRIFFFHRGLNPLSAALLGTPTQQTPQYTKYENYFQRFWTSYMGTDGLTGKKKRYNRPTAGMRVRLTGQSL